MNTLAWTSWIVSPIPLRCGSHPASSLPPPSNPPLLPLPLHKDLIPVINRALRTPKLKAASLVATLERDYNQMGKLWDERQRRRPI